MAKQLNFDRFNRDKYTQKFAGEFRNIEWPPGTNSTELSLVVYIAL